MKLVLEVFLPDCALVSGAVPSQPVQQRPDDPELFELLLGLQVVLGLVVPGVDQAEVVVERVGAVDEVLERLPRQLRGQEEGLPIVLRNLQVPLRRGRPHLLALGDLLVFFVGEVLGFQDVDDLLLNLGLLPLRRRPTILRLLWGDSGW